MNKSAWVIIPVYNEAEVIGSVVDGLKKQFKNIVCVDDGSSDGSADLILKNGAELVVHTRNQGQGAALRTGVQYALQKGAQYFITFDADGQHRVEDAVKMLKYLKKNDVDIVLGSRFLGAQAEGLPVTKRVVLKAAIVFSNVTTGLKLTDTHNGLRVFNRNVASKLKLTCSGMAHASEIIYRVAENKFIYAELPVTIKYSRYSKAKGQSIFNAFNIVKEIVVYRLQKES